MLTEGVRTIGQDWLVRGEGMWVEGLGMHFIRTCRFRILESLELLFGASIRLLLQKHLEVSVELGLLWDQSHVMISEMLSRCTNLIQYFVLYFLSPDVCCYLKTSLQDQRFVS